MVENQPLKRSIDELTKVLDRWPNQPPQDVDWYNMMRSTRDGLQLVKEELDGAYEQFQKILTATMEASSNLIHKLEPPPEEEPKKKHHGYA